VQQLGDQARAELAKAPGAGAEIAKKLDLQFASVKDGAPGEAIPGLGVSSEISGALTGMKVNDVSEALTIPGNRMAIVTLKGVTPSRAPDYETVADRVRDRFIATRSQDLARLASEDAAKRAKAGESLEAIAKAMKLDIVKTGDLTVNDTGEGLGPMGVLVDAFAKSAGTVLGPTLVQGRAVVYKILEQKSVDPSQYAYERDAAYQELKQQKAKTAYELLQDSVLHKARADGKLKIYTDRIQRLAASYRAGR
jgi:hypothetical protein